MTTIATKDTKEITEFLSDFCKKPSFIKKDGKKSVIISEEQYGSIKNFLELFEDAAWEFVAANGMASGYLSEQESEKLTEKLLNA